MRLFRFNHWVILLLLSMEWGIGSGCGSATGPIQNAQKKLFAHSHPITLALKFVEFAQLGGGPVLSRAHVNRLVDQVGTIFSTCNIQFQVEKYSVIRASDYGLPNHLDSTSEIFKVRQPFDDPNALVVIDTGSWDHSKMGSPNAWTAMPGELPSGAVMEAPVATFAGIVAHELGHYLSLSHVNNTKNLMNPIIYNDSTQLLPQQCKDLRANAMTVRSHALRNIKS